MRIRFALLAFAFVASTASLPASAADGGRANSVIGDKVNPDRFGARGSDQAYGAFQRGLYITAFNLALPRAENGDPAAQTLVAEILAQGLGRKRDEAEAAKWYAKAAEQGIPEAQFQYALMLLDGRFMPKDAKTAYALMQAAAEAGNRMAQFNFAQMIVQQEPGEAGLEKAVPYYRRAAEARLADAEYAMAQFSQSGLGGVKQDPKEAQRWLLRAARQNYDSAQLDLGTQLVEGRTGVKDEDAGFMWLRLAALGGNPAAQARLAKLYMTGIGTEPDNSTAASWYFLARRAGLRDSVLEDLLDGMTMDEQKVALERANRLR